jgi:CubicO group peptidase (beta-lactamase class C family)
VTIPVPTTDATNVGAAAAMASNARDLAQWLRFLLARGVSDDIRLLSAEAFDRAFSNQISIGTTSYGAVYYGLGWFVTQYKGHKLVTHGGKLGGFESIVALLPDQQLGYALLTNVHESVLPGIVLDHTLTHLVAARTPANTGSKAQEKGTKVAPKAQ